MTLLLVDSSLLATIGYDAHTRVLHLEFRDRTKYQYFDVPAEVYDLLLAEHSKGQCFNRSIRGRFRYVVSSK
jgi:hypothetical protein